eukprot:gene3687-biopygen2218
MEELNRKEELKKGKSSEEFTAAYIDRNPWVKELLNTRDMWKRHHEAVQSDAEAWEARVRDNYLARAKSGALSPLLTLIGEYLLFAVDKEIGRQHLLEILYMADPSARLAVHNWSILDSVDGLVETHGPKVESLELPLFPPTNADMAALNARILLLTSEASRKEESFGGGMPLHMLKGPCS